MAFIGRLIIRDFMMGPRIQEEFESPKQSSEGNGTQSGFGLVRALKTQTNYRSGASDWKPVSEQMGKLLN